VTTGAINRAKLQSNHHQQTNKHNELQSLGVYRSDGSIIIGMNIYRFMPNN